MYEVVKAHSFKCCNPTLKECENEIHTPEMGTWESTRTPKFQSLIARVKTPHIGAFFLSLESYQSVDVKNGLAWAIWTSTTQIMAKRKAESQIGSLTIDH
jgi:hypothetical protein